MLTRLRINLVPPNDDDTFEELICDLCSKEWCDPNTERFGRSGQKQFGVDVYGQPVDASGKHRGAQAKLRSTGRQLSEAEIRDEVTAACNFPHELDELILMTTAPRDTTTQTLVNTVSAEEQAHGGFKVSLRSWERIGEQLAAYPALLVKYYRDHYTALTTNAQFDQLIHIPITINYLPHGTDSTLDLRHFLALRGMRFTNSVGHLDGFVLHLAANAEPIKAVAASIPHLRGYHPCFVVLSPEQQAPFLDACGTLSIDITELEILTDNWALNNLADHILERCFAYGRQQRGQLATLAVCVRTRPNQPNSALLDLDWQAPLAQGFPSEALWRDQLEPALKSVTQQLLNVRDSAFITLESYLYLPLAVAVGFHLNVRLANLGVWTRKREASDFSRQFWFSGGAPADVTFTATSFIESTDNSSTVVLELSTMGSIHHDVRPFIDRTLTPDAWLELQMRSALEDTKDINEPHAVAFAEQVGQLVRELRSRGMQDLHLFLKMPSALGVLIGQRLQACGRVHMYWFDNPSYQYAFTLR